MSAPRQILAAIFDMDGLIMDSEPLWDRAELDVMASLGVDITRRDELPDTLGLRIDMVVGLWFARQPWTGPDCEEVTQRIISRAIALVEETRPLLPGAREAIALCKPVVLKWVWPRHRRCICWKKRSLCSACAIISMRWRPPKNCPTANRIRRFIWTVPQSLALTRLPVWRWKILSMA